MYNLIVEAEYISEEVFAKGTSFASFQVSDTLSSWNAWLTNINDGIATIQTDTQVIKLNLTEIDIKLTSIQGSIVILETDIGTIKADISDISDELAGWHVTSLEIVSGATTYELYALTTSSLDEASISDNILSLVVSGIEGSSGVTHIVVPKTLLSSLGSSVDRVTMTLDGEKVEFSTTEDAEAYTLTISYSHSAREIKIYLEGLPMIDLTLVFIFSAAVAVVVALAVALYVFKIRGRS